MGRVTLNLDRRHVNTLVDCVQEMRHQLAEGTTSADRRGYDELTDILWDLLDQLGEDMETIQERTGRERR